MSGTSVRSKRIEWPPPADAPRRVRGVQWNRDGDMTLVPLRRQPNDKALRGSLTNSCCGCGLSHLMTLEVFRTPGGAFYLGKRSYRLSERRRPPKGRRG